MQDASLLNRAEQVVCEVDLRQYQQMQQAAQQAVHTVQQPEEHVRTAVS